MSSSSRPRRVIQVVREDEDVYLVGEPVPGAAPAAGAVTTAAGLVEAARRQAAAILADAEALAREITAGAGGEAAAAREQGFAAGLAAGRQEALDDFAEALAVVRAAAADGKAIRDELAGQAAAVVARAVALATRRVVGEYYELAPERTALACAEALRAAAGQEILALRVHPGVAGAVQVQLADAAGYVRPDDAIEVGGCVIDLRNGTLDATLDARLSLMAFALEAAGGEVAA